MQGHNFHDPELARLAAIARSLDLRMSWFGPKPVQPSQPSPQQQQAQTVPGAMYGAPGYTNPVEQLDTTQGLVTAGSGSSQNTINGITPLAQTDVVFGWDLFITYSFANAPTGGTGQTLSVSPYAPYNMLGPVTLSLQNQYKPIDVLSGRDLGIFQSYRPTYLRSDRRNANLASPVLSAAYSSGLWCEAQLLEGADVWSTTYTTTGKTFVVHLPASIEFDLYYPLDVSGNLVGTPGRAIVSPQYMGGTTRIVSPKITLAQGLGTVDTSPFGTTTLTAGGDTASTWTQGYSTSLDIRRRAVYSSNNPAALPPVQPWQYALHTWEYGCGAQSKITIPIPNDVGQILSIWALLFDPAAASGAGAPLAMSSINYCQLKYGSGLFRYDDTPTSMQARWIQQHDTLPAAGFVGWDLAYQPDGRLTNQGGVLNTLTTNAIQIVLTLGTPMSSSGYVVVGTESLQYVVPQ
jgi:hypothetical protein